VTTLSRSRSLIGTTVVAFLAILLSLEYSLGTPGSDRPQPSPPQVADPWQSSPPAGPAGARSVAVVGARDRRAVLDTFTFDFVFEHAGNTLSLIGDATIACTLDRPDGSRKLSVHASTGLQLEGVDGSSVTFRVAGCRQVTSVLSGTTRERTIKFQVQEGIVARITGVPRPSRHRLVLASAHEGGGFSGSPNERISSTIAGDGEYLYLGSWNHPRYIVSLISHGSAFDVGFVEQEVQAPRDQVTVVDLTLGSQSMRYLTMAKEVSDAAILSGFDVEIACSSIWNHWTTCNIPARRTMRILAPKDARVRIHVAHESPGEPIEFTERSVSNGTTMVSPKRQFVVLSTPGSREARELFGAALTPETLSANRNYHVFTRRHWKSAGHVFVRFGDKKGRSVAVDALVRVAHDLYLVSAESGRTTGNLKVLPPVRIARVDVGLVIEEGKQGERRRRVQYLQRREDGFVSTLLPAGQYRVAWFVAGTRMGAWKAASVYGSDTATVRLPPLRLAQWHGQIAQWRELGLRQPAAISLGGLVCPVSTSGRFQFHATSWFMKATVTRGAIMTAAGGAELPVDVRVDESGRRINATVRGAARARFIISSETLEDAAIWVLSSSRQAVEVPMPLVPLAKRHTRGGVNLEVVREVGQSVAIVATSRASAYGGWAVIGHAQAKAGGKVVDLSCTGRWVRFSSSGGADIYALVYGRAVWLGRCGNDGTLKAWVPLGITQVVARCGESRTVRDLKDEHSSCEIHE